MNPGPDNPARNGPAGLSLRIYVAGQSPNSTLALTRIRALCAQVKHPCELEVVDLLAHPERALRDGVVLTPLVVRVFPQPEVRVVGNLSDANAVRRLLNVGERS